MLKELKVDEIKELAKKQSVNSELKLLLNSYAKWIEEGVKLIVKEKTTNKGKSIVFYNYDDKLYRYIKNGEFYI